ncbi:MAG TPA: phage protein Gp37 [Phycisphaerae bacterium]|nr:phage protein Gp37 [Phycisphaerae bacterium]
MSRLGDFENEIVDRLETATVSGSAAFARIVGASGGWRPANRDAIFRERMPAAYVAFVEEPAAPEVRDAVRGAKFVVLIAARSLRVDGDARHGETGETGAFALIDAVRAVLDDYEIDDGLQLVCVHVRFVEADARSAVYELLYRVWPVVAEEEPPLLKFKDENLVGTLSRMELEVGPTQADSLEVEYHNKNSKFTKALTTGIRTLVWRGEIRAETHEDLNDIEAAIDEFIVGGNEGAVEETSVRTLEDCKILTYFRQGGRTTRDGLVVQAGEILFEQAV